MSWKNIPIGGKLAIGFGLVLLLLSIISIFSWSGFHFINAGIAENLYLSSIKELALQKEIDHLQWRNSISDLFSDVQKKSLEAEADDHKCKLGVWLVSYTVHHFGTEEKLFQKHGYPEYDQHKKAHENLVGKVKELKTKIDRGDATISMELMDFLIDWLVTHIKGTDKKYVPFLQEKGVR